MDLNNPTLRYSIVRLLTRDHNKQCKPLAEMRGWDYTPYLSVPKDQRAPFPLRPRLRDLLLHPRGITIAGFLVEFHLPRNKDNATRIIGSTFHAPLHLSPFRYFRGTTAYVDLSGFVIEDEDEGEEPKIRGRKQA